MCFASMYIDCSLKLKDGGHYEARVCTSVGYIGSQIDSSHCEICPVESTPRLGMLTYIIS